MGGEMVMDDGRGRSNLIGEILPRTTAFISILSVVQALSEFSLFAVYSRVLHPALVLSAHVLGIVVLGCTAGFKRDFIQSLYMPARQFLLCPLPIWSSRKKMEAEARYGMRNPALFIVVRVVFLGALCFCMELPEGLVPLGSLG